MDADHILELHERIAALCEISRAFTTKERQKLADEGKAMPDGSFPVVTEEDLKNAIKAVGKAEDVDAARKHIKKRAKALGLTKLIPFYWK